MIYLAGVTPTDRDEINTRLSFSSGQLPVRYLGLPLLTKKMTAADYYPLLEKIRTRIGSWTARFLSLAGRLQLISSVLMSFTNFWLSAFRLPKACLKEIEKLCSSFLWSGPEMNPKKAKMAWTELCKPKNEGGLGLKPLMEVNNVFSLKLIWRILSARSSLWVNWIRSYLLRKETFWSIRNSTSMGSWMWRKILKTRPLAREFHKIQVRNGESTSFWYDKWSDFGSLYDVLGPRGVVDMGIPLSATVASAWMIRRRRNHRTDILCDIEKTLELERTKSVVGETDIHVWRQPGDKFKNSFNSKKTWLSLRETGPTLSWCKGVWFKHATPKYSMFTWLANHNRLATGDRMALWNVGANTSCIFCRFPMESRNHLFFTCGFSSQIWAWSTKELLKSQYATDWDSITSLVSGSSRNSTSLFLLRYIFQAMVHTIWRERNARRHGEVPKTPLVIQKMIDKQIRNRCTTIEDEQLKGSLQLWFSIRSL